MKKLIATVLLSVGLISFSALMASETGTPTGETDYTKVHTHIRKVVYPKLYDLVDYNPKKSFSRCPSGFAHSIEEEKTQDMWVFGTMYYRQGCSSETFCYFKMNMETEKVFLKKENEKTYASLSNFVDNYGDETTEI